MPDSTNSRNIPTLDVLPWEKLRMEENRFLGRSHLKLRVSDKGLDKAAQLALTRLANSKAFAVSDDELDELIDRLDMASVAKKVTERINRAKLSNAQRQVIAATINYSLSKALERFAEEDSSSSDDDASDASLDSLQGNVSENQTRVEHLEAENEELKKYVEEQHKALEALQKQVHRLEEQHSSTSKAKQSAVK